MCEMQKYLSPTFFKAQEYYLIHQVEVIELCGPVNSRLMWMVERHLKSLKDFVRQRSRPGGSFVHGYMIYQSMVYISEYLPNLEKISICLAFGMSTPSTNLNGRSCRGKVERGKSKVIEWCKFNLLYN